MPLKSGELTWRKSRRSWGRTKLGSHISHLRQRLFSSLESMNPIHDDPNGQEHQINRYGKRGRILEPTEETRKPAKAKKCLAKNASLLALQRGAQLPGNNPGDHDGQHYSQTSPSGLGKEVRFGFTTTVRLSQMTVDELCVNCQENYV
jgi:hypothetical protein